MTFKHIGSVSHGTLRPEDLLEAFADMLETLCNENPRPADVGKDVICMGSDSASPRELVKDARTWLVANGCAPDAESITADDAEHEEIGAEIVNELIDAINGFAPDYFYFGAHPGDGADFGFWLSEDWQERMQEDGVLIASDWCEIPSDYRGNVCLVNDHGNATYGYVGGYDEFIKVFWSVV